MKCRWLFLIVFALLILSWGCQEPEEPAALPEPDADFFPLTMDKSVTYPINPDLFPPQWIPTTDPFHPVCKEVYPDAGQVSCEASVQFLYCRLFTPMVYNGMTYDQKTALDQCHTGTDFMWRRFRRCANSVNSNQIISCLERNGVPAEFTDFFDIDSLAPDIAATNRFGYSALNYRVFYGSSSGPNSESYQIWLGIRDGQTGDATILFTYNQYIGLYDSHTIGAIGGNLPGIYPETDFWLAGIDLHITDLFFITVAPYLGILQFLPTAP